jgi:putative tricarboxylic transport membrane protein
MLQMLENLLRGHSISVPKSERKLFNFRELRQTWWTSVRGGLVGSIVGVLPGAGASIASAVAYSSEKKLVEGRDSEAQFGKGDLRGLAAPEAANNASATGSFIPMLTLGVPGSGTTAVMMGALTLYNITPGPALFEYQPQIVWGLIASLFIANFMLLMMNIPMVRIFAAMLNIPSWLLVPGILAISFIGVWALNGTNFDLYLVVIIGLVGYFFRKLDVPLAPLVLGVVLGNLMEQNLRRALSISNGELGILFQSNISIALWVLAISVIVFPPMMRRWIGGRKAPAN